MGSKSRLQEAMQAVIERLAARGRFTEDDVLREMMASHRDEVEEAFRGEMLEPFVRKALDEARGIVDRGDLRA